METLDLEIYRGDTFVEQLTILDDDGNPVDVSTMDFAAEIRRVATSETVMATFTVAIVDGPNGVVSITLYPSETEDLAIPTTSWAWDFQTMTDAATPVVTTRFLGEVTVVGDVTRP